MHPDVCAESGGGGDEGGGGEKAAIRQPDRQAWHVWPCWWRWVKGLDAGPPRQVVHLKAASVPTPLEPASQIPAPPPPCYHAHGDNNLQQQVLGSALRQHRARLPAGLPAALAHSLHGPADWSPERKRAAADAAAARHVAEAEMSRAILKSQERRPADFATLLNTVPLAASAACMRPAGGCDAGGGHAQGAKAAAGSSNGRRSSQLALNLDVFQQRLAAEAGAGVGVGAAPSRGQSACYAPALSKPPSQRHSPPHLAARSGLNPASSGRGAGPGADGEAAGWSGGAHGPPAPVGTHVLSGAIAEQWEDD